MYRLMQPSDEAAVLALWQSQHHDTEDFAKMVLERFAGVQNIYVADENDTIVAAALAVPVTLQGRTGNYLCLCGEGSLLLAGLLDTLCAQQKLRGAGFTVAVPADAAQAALLQDKGFAQAFALRCLPREVSRNLWSQAEFDTVTDKKLCKAAGAVLEGYRAAEPGAHGGGAAGAVRPGRYHRVQRAWLRHLLPQGGYSVFCGNDG